MRVLFLDIDGVLNGHEVLKDAGCCGIDRRCVEQLNRVLHETQCKIALSSAWRYMILNGAMTLDGFWHMMRTHGLSNRGKGNPIIGTTREDLAVNDYNERGKQIRQWVELRGVEVERYCAVDDEDYGHTVMGVPLVRTDGTVGLERQDADRLIELLVR